MKTEHMMNTMLVMDILIAVVGVYLIYIACKMKKTKKIDRLVIAEEVLMRCRDEAAFAAYLSPKMLIFAIVLTITGILLALHETVFPLGAGFYVVTAVAVIAFLWFYKMLTDGRNKYCM